MKKYIPLMFLVALAGCSNSNTVAQSPEKSQAEQDRIFQKQKELEKECKFLDSMAFMIMGARQKGVPITNIMDSINEVNAESTKVLKDLAVEAYTSPIEDSLEFKKKAISEFANTVYTSCYIAKGATPN